ncbi:hypothetical protein [Runella sp.]|uniref:hypothetical protein n=1 Tax=Runella sp. TaxID=1960881 RepID=UPI003D1430E3
MLKTIGVALVVFVFLGYFFVQWANKPENVDALLKAREEEKKQAVKDSIKAEADKKQHHLEEVIAAQKEAEIQHKTAADLKLVIDETFKNNRLDYLQPAENSLATTKDNRLVFAATAYKKNSVDYILALTKNDYDNFVAELDMELWGDELSVGVVFNYAEGQEKTIFGKIDTWKADRLSSSLQGVRLSVNDEEDRERLTTLKEELTFKSIQKQKVRLEKKGKHLKVSVNGQVKFDKKIEKYSNSKGKMGIYAAVSNSGNWNKSVIGHVKSFKVWTW